MDVKTKNSLTNEAIRDLLNNSANKTNNNLIFFFSFGLYVFISVINTSDIALLLPRHSFKMPFIDFELGLLHFYILAPLLLLLLHFNLLFNHYKNLEKLDKYQNKINIKTINPSLYGFAFTTRNIGLAGSIINHLLYTLLYILPLIVFITMYIRFSDYHHSFITPFHLLIILIDIGFILASMYHVNKYRQKKIRLSFVIFPVIFFIMFDYFCSYYIPTVYADYNSKYKEKSENKLSCRAINYISYKLINIISPKDKYEAIVCYPRLIVTEEEMAKISKSALYIPRYLTMKNTHKDSIEHDLIIKHGTRIDLSGRNLRYAILKRNILTRANLKNTELQGANLNDAHMQATDLTNVKLIDASMIGVKLEAAELGGAQLQGVLLTDANMRKITAFSSPFWPEDKSARTNFSDADMQKADLTNAEFTNVNFRNVDFRGADLNLTSFNNSDLTGSSLSLTNITSSTFSKATLDGTDFSDVKIYPFPCEKLELMKKEHNASKMCGLPNFYQATIIGANLFNFDINKTLNLDKNQTQYTVDVNLTNYKLFETRKIQYLAKAITQIKDKNVTDANLTNKRMQLEYMKDKTCENVISKTQLPL